MDLPESPAFLPYTRWYFDPSTFKELWKVPLGGGAPSQVTSTSASGDAHTDAVASPDFSKIAFLNRSGGVGNARLYVCNADGSGALQLDSADCNVPSWSPDGSKILYRRVGNLLTINPDGTGQTTVLSKSNVIRPAYTYDGAKIVYQIDNTNPTVDELWVINADGTGDTQLDSNTGLGGAPVFACAQTQNKVAYLIVGTGLYVINTDGTGKTQVSTSVVHLTRFSWKPDDSAILGSINVAGSERVYSISPTGAGESALSPTLDTAPQVPLQGSARVHSGKIYTVSDSPDFDLTMADLDGSGQTILDDTSDEATYSVVFQLEDG